MHVLPLFYKASQGFYNVSKTYLRQWTLQKLPKMWNHRKTRNPLFYAGPRAYLPWHCLYLRPEPHVQWYLVLSLFIVFMVLIVFAYFIGQCRFGIYSICGIYSTYSIYHRMTNGWRCQHFIYHYIILIFYFLLYYYMDYTKDIHIHYL